MTLVQNKGNIYEDVGVHYVRPADLHVEWPRAYPLISRAQKRLEDKMDMADIYQDIHNGSQQLWVIDKSGKSKGAVVTAVETHPKCKVLRIMLVGGFDMREWLIPALNVIKDAAKLLDCKTIEADGRLGWAKHAPKCGFKEITRTYELEI